MRARAAAQRRSGAPAHRRAGGARVLVERSGGVATLTLNRPEKRNALDRRAIAELAAAIEACDLAADVRVVAIRGAGRDFCAGADLADLLESADLAPEERERRAMELGEVFLALRALPKPTVAVVRGRALAGGCALATACDIVVAEAGAALGYPEIERGLAPALVMAALRRAAGEKVAADLLLTGRVVGAAEAQRLGLVSRVLPARGFDPAVTKVLAALAGRSASALALTKQLLHGIDGVGFEDSVRRGARVSAVARGTPEFRAGVAAFLEKR